MLESFMVAFNAVGPFLILLGIGFAAVRLKLTDRPFMDRLNALNYRLFFPFLMFNNVYSAKPENMPSVKLMLTGSLSVILLVVLLVIIVPKIVKENPRRGVVIQGIFRSNFIIYGIPLTTYVFGTEKSSVCGMMIMIMVSIFNIAAVIVLELFREGGKIRPGALLLGIVKNPLLQGCVVGLLFYLLQIRLPSFVATPVSSLAGAATTIALVVLGANLKFDELKKNSRTISVVLVIRLILLPVVMVAFAYLIGLRGVELFLILMIFGTPVATSSYPMAQNMGGDGQLAGQLVFVSTVASLATIFVFIGWDCFCEKLKNEDYRALPVSVPLPGRVRVLTVALRATFSREVSSCACSRALLSSREAMPSESWPIRCPPAFSACRSENNTPKNRIITSASVISSTSHRMPREEKTGRAWTVSVTTPRFREPAFSPLVQSCTCLEE